MRVSAFRTLAFLGVGLVGAALLGLVTWTLGAPPRQASEVTVARGLEVYKAQYCGTCHQLTLAGTKGTFGPPHDALGVIAGARIQNPTYRGQATSAETYIRESIVNPKAYLVPGYGLTYHHMPAYTALSKKDLDALVTLLEQDGARQ